MLGKMIEENREHIVARACEKLRETRGDLGDEIEQAVHAFVSELVKELKSGRREPSDGAMVIGTEVGAELGAKGHAVPDAVFSFGVVCDATTEFAMERDLELSARDVHIMNLTIDKASAAATAEYVREYERKREQTATEQLGTFAHELRNGLAGAVYAFHALSIGKLGIDSRTGVLLGKSLARLQEMVDRSLTDVRLGSELTLRRERVRIAHVFLELRDAMEGAAKSRGISLTVQADLGLEVEADRQLLASALSNLLQNAIKYTYDGGGIALRGIAKGDRVAFEVEDECGGLPAGKAEELFEPFVQKGPDRTGLGLGLSIVRRAVKAHGGVVTVRDLPGKGCIFRIELPMRDGGLPDSGPAPQSTEDGVK